MYYCTDWHPRTHIIQLVWLQGLLQLARPSPAPAMGRISRATCYWCGDAEKLILVRGVGKPLCEHCLDMYIDCEGPPQPDATTRLLNVLQEILPILPESALQGIAEFCHYWHEP